MENGGDRCGFAPYSYRKTSHRFLGSNYYVECCNGFAKPQNERFDISKAAFPHFLVLSTLILTKRLKRFTFYLVLALVLVTTPLFVPVGFRLCNLLLQELHSASFTLNPYEEKSGKRLNKTKMQLAIKIRQT